jgi:hypothetical protein
MDRIVVTEFVTLDGVMEDPGGAEGSEFGGWSFRFERGAEGDRFKLDELRLMVHPIVLGSGRRLFVGVRSPRRLALRETRRAGETLILIYERAVAEAPGA